MPLPGGLTTITVTGTYVDSFGNPLSGSIDFTPSPQIIAPGTSVLYAKPTAANLDSSGHFSVTLTCTDNSALIPAGWYYTVTENIAGTRSYPVYVPHTLGSSVDISSLIPVPTYNGIPAIVPSGNVAPGYATLASTQTWTGANTFTGAVTFSGAVTLPGYLATGAAAGGDLGGTYPNPGVAKVNGVAVTGTPSANQVIVATGPTAASWQNAPSAGGGVQIAGDLGGTNSVPTVTGTHLASPLPIAQGGTAAASASAARTALGLGTAAVADIDTVATDIQPLGTRAAGAVGKAADAGHVHAAPTLDQLAAAADVSLGSHKITALTAGVLASDGANVGQIPTTLPPTGAAGGDLAGTFPNPTVSATANFKNQVSTVRLDQLAAPTASVGLGSQKITALLAGVAGTDGVNVSQLPVVPAAATTVVSETGYGQASAVGADTTWAREDHTHGSPSLTGAAPATTLGIGQGAAVGTASTPARADHVHPLAAAGAPAASAVGDTVVTGVATTFAASDHKHAREAFGAVTAQSAYGAASATGTATTLSHSDHVHGTVALTTTAPATTEAIGTAAALGTAVLPALADHVHPMAGAATPTTSAVGDAAATGAATTFAASNHVHGREAFGGAPATTLGIGTAAAAGSASTPSRSDHVHPVAAAAAPAASAVGDSVVTGVATTYAASDHKHAREAFAAPAAATVFGAASVTGSAATVAHSDHVHGLPDVYAYDSPHQRGWSEWNYPPLSAVAVSQNLTSQSVYGVSMIAQTNNAITKVGVQVVSSASTPTSGQNLIGYYTVAGTTATQQTVTADLGTWSSAGFQSYALGAGQTLVAGTTIILLFMSNATTPVHLQGFTSDTAAQIGFLNLGLLATAAPFLKFFVYGTGLTALPASFAISGSTMTGTNALAPWACLL